MYKKVLTLKKYQMNRAIIFFTFWIVPGLLLKSFLNNFRILSSTSSSSLNWSLTLIARYNNTPSSFGTVSGGTSGGAGGSSRGDVSSGDDVSWLDSTLGLDCGEILAEKKNQIFRVFYEEVTYYYSFVKSYTNFFFI